MKKVVELPIAEPVYSTYLWQGPGSVGIVNNPSIRNWFLNVVTVLTCNRRFLQGFTTPEVSVVGSNYLDNPHLEKIRYPLQHLNEGTNPLIRNLLDDGYYVYFWGIDDYYVPGKSWYKERHFCHDGTICGYNEEDKTFCIHAYDSTWIYRKFWTPQKAFTAGKKGMFEVGRYGHLCAIKPKMNIVEFSPEIACGKIQEHLDSTMVNYPPGGEDAVYGVEVYNYLALYLDKLADGSIPCERMDPGVFHLVWEHKKVMLERVVAIEQALSLDNTVSTRYTNLVNNADHMRMLYATHHAQRRDSVLPVIRERLLALKEEEVKLLTELMGKAKAV